MDINDLHPPDDYSHRFFIWHEWIQANGQLTNENVFDYFATSMFYDKQSNNQVLRMQTMHTGMPIVNEAEELKRFTGIEFAVVHAQPQHPSIFIIHKRERLSPDEVRPLAAYFIMNNRIYQSPDVYSVVSNRLLTSLYSLQSSLDTLREHRPDYTPRTGVVWPIVDSSSSEDSAKKRGTEEEAPNTDRDQRENFNSVKRNVVPVPNGANKRQNNMLLLNAMRTTAIHSKTSFSTHGLDNGPEIGTTEIVGAWSSATPVPAGRRSTTPKGTSNSPTPQDPPVKGLPGAGKKKRKRTSL